MNSCAHQSRERQAALELSVVAMLGCVGVLFAGCAAMRGVRPEPRAFHGQQTNTGPERYASWFGDSDGHVLYFGLSPFLELWEECQRSDGTNCPLRDLDQPGDHLIGRFDLDHERFLPPLLVRPLDARALSSVWDVLVHSNGRIYYTTFWDEFGSVRRDGSDVRYYEDSGLGLNELWEGPAGEIYVTRYVGSLSASPDENGAVAVFGPDGDRRRELPFTVEDGVLICPKSVAVDPGNGEIWVNSDIFHPDGRVGHDTFQLSPTGEIIERFAEPQVDFLSFDATGRGWFAESSGGRFVVRIVSPDGTATELDLGPHGPIDFVQDIEHIGEMTLLTTWALTVYAVRTRPDGQLDTVTLSPERPRDCPKGPVLGYTALAAADGRVYETVTCGITVIRAGALSP